MLAIVYLFVALICAGLLFWLAFYLINTFVPEPARKLATAVVVCIFVFALVIFLWVEVLPMLQGSLGGYHRELPR